MSINERIMDSLEAEKNLSVNTTGIHFHSPAASLRGGKKTSTDVD